MIGRRADRYSLLRTRGVHACWAAVLLVVLFSSPSARGSDQDMTDFSEQATAICELIGLEASPPAGWFSVPMVDLPAGMSGCQMMRTDEDDAPVGIIRLSASDTGARSPGEESRNRQLAIELEVLAAMGIQARDRLWLRQDVPVTGERDAGFSKAQAVGLSAVIEGSGLPQEVHILAFHGPSTQYALLLITPSQETEPAIHSRNVADFAKLIQSLKVTSTDD
jgi:hypothetical protein